MGTIYNVWLHTCRVCTRALGLAACLPWAGRGTAGLQAARSGGLPTHAHRSVRPQQSTAPKITSTDSLTTASNRCLLPTE